MTRYMLTPTLALAPSPRPQPSFLEGRDARRLGIHLGFDRERRRDHAGRWLATMRLLVCATSLP
jgi:hypothetical protein